MTDFKKYCGADGQRAIDKLSDKIKRERQEYEMKLNKLNELYAEGLLPDTEFIDSFIPRVTNKFKMEMFPLSSREKEVIDDMFDKY